MIPAAKVDAAIFPFFPLASQNVFCLSSWGSGFACTNLSIFNLLTNNNSTLIGGSQINLTIVEAKIYITPVSIIKSTMMKLKMITALLVLTTFSGCYYHSGNIVLNTYTGVNAVALNGRLYGAINHSPG